MGKVMNGKSWNFKSSKECEPCVARCSSGDGVDFIALKH